MIIGIDPGVTGGIGVLSEQGEFMEVHDMPVVKVKVGKRTQRRVHVQALHGLLMNLASRGRRIQCPAFVEWVWPRSQEGAVSSFSFGRAVGAIEGVLVANGFECVFVSPQKWKRYFELLGKEKDSSRILAHSLFPGASLKRKKDHGRAEALLIGRYGAHTGGK